MSNFSTARRVRTAALVAAPLTVLALGLSACSPKHITTMDSPTPKSSDTAHAAAASESEESSESDAPTQASETAEPSSAPSTEAAAAPSDAASFLKADGSTYEVSGLTVAGAEVDPGVFTGITVSGDAAGEDGALLTTVGLCAGTTYTVTESGQDAYTFDAAGSANFDKCVEADEADVAEKLDDALSGDVEVSVDGASVQLVGQGGTLDLTVAR